MLKRPTVTETEEDLLKQEEEFLKKLGKAPTRKRTHDVETFEKEAPRVAGVIGDIIEKNERHLFAPNHNSSDRDKGGFPALFEIDPNIKSNKKGKKSLFALHMERRKPVSHDTKMEIEVEENLLTKDEESLMECEDIVNQSEVQETTHTVNDIKKSIHNENMDKLSKMSEDEILAAQKKLYETLDPKLVNLLKYRGKLKEVKETKPVLKPEVIQIKDDSEVQDENDIKEKLSNYVGEKWVNMDFVEREKLEWVGDIPDSKALEPDKPYSARFDFKGELQPFTMETIDVTKSLHHHGDEPDRPGYTIQELYQLSRSTVLQQRILALNTLANIIRKTKLGYYDVCFDGFLLHKLLESDLFLLLRFSIDENALIPAAINCLCKLLNNDTDEYCLDKLLGVTDDVQPLIYDKLDANEDEEKELKDNTIINCDVIKGVLRTDLLVRITYILNNIPCDRETITNAILCFIRISRHSLISSRQILNKSDLLKFLYSCIRCDKPIYQAVKLFRLLTGQSGEMASEIIQNYPMNFLITFLSLESMPDIPKAEFYLLKLESLYLWRNFLKHDLMIGEFVSWTPCFIRFLRFYVEKVDLTGEGDFDFELFSAMISVLRVCVNKKLQIDSNYVAVMYICLEKWLKQLMHFQNFNYSGLKALSGCFYFFIDYFRVFEIDQSALRFIQKLNEIIANLIGSQVFEDMASSLVRYSHVLICDVVKRDPSNLPSLNSVYREGYDCLRLVNNRSSLPFFMSLAKYLKCCYAVTHDTKNNIELVFRCSNIRKYVSKVVKMNRNVENWFMRYELELLTEFLHLMVLIRNEDTLKLGFRLLPMFRIDDDNSKSILAVITDKNIWNCGDDFFDNLYHVYLDCVHTSPDDSSCGLRYKNELIEEDWMFKVFRLLREKEAVAEVTKALKYINFITKSNATYLERVPYNMRYYHLCSVFLTDANVFDEEIQKEMKISFGCILSNRGKVELDKKVEKNKSFYDLYTELITQYAGVSYGLHIFAEFVLFPLQNKFDVSFRKLLWFEYLHVLRVITLPYPVSDFIDIRDFVEPCETDESLLVTYLNAISNNVIIRTRNPFVYNIAVNNIKNYLQSDGSDSKLTSFLKGRINCIKNERVRQDLTI